MKAYRQSLIFYNPSTKDINDRRKKVSKAVFMYVSESGYEYRRGFTSKPNTHENTFFDIAPLTIDVNE